MREEPRPWKHGVVLVCTNEREPGASKPSCGKARGTRLRQQLKLAARAESGPVSECRVLATSCLDVCPHDGLVVAVEPGGATFVVDPDTDQPALLARIKTEIEAAAGGRSRARRALSRFKGS